MPRPLHAVPLAEAASPTGAEAASSRGHRPQIPPSAPEITLQDPWGRRDSARGQSPGVTRLPDPQHFSVTCTAPRSPGPAVVSVLGTGVRQDANSGVTGIPSGGLCRLEAGRFPRPRLSLLVCPTEVGTQSSQGGARPERELPGTGLGLDARRLPPPPLPVTPSHPEELERGHHDVAV